MDDARVDIGSRRMTHAIISLAQPGAASRRVDLAFPAAGLDWEPGKLTFRLNGERLQGGWALVRMRKALQAFEERGIGRVCRHHDDLGRKL